MSSDLNPEKALIFRIVHRDNVPWILDHGLHCRSSGVVDPNYVEIGNPDLISKRNYHPVPTAPGGTLSDYVPFYFTPFSPMLLNITTGWAGIRKREKAEIVIMVTSLHHLKTQNVPFLFVDRHAYLVAAQFYTELDKLDQIDWQLLQRRDFRADPDDPSKKEKYQAEALVHRHLSVNSLLGFVTYDDEVKLAIDQALTNRAMTAKVVKKPGWYL
jgi:hypothetical protein